jgi:hypothetical protein
MKNISHTTVLVLFCLLSSIAFSQRSSVKFRGTVTEKGIPMAGVHVYIMDAGARKSELHTDSTGKFQVESYFNKMIYIHFVKEGYVAQRVWATTRLRNMAQYNTKMNFDFKLIKQPADGRILTFNKPVEKVKYNYDTGKFQFDPAYHKQIQAKKDELKKQITAKKSN